MTEVISFLSKFRLKWKQVGKTTRPLRYDLNQIPYDYTVEVRNRLNGIDLVGSMPDELCMEVRNIAQEWQLEPSPRKINARGQSGCLSRPYR